MGIAAGVLTVDEARAMEGLAPANPPPFQPKNPVPEIEAPVEGASDVA